MGSIAKLFETRSNLSKPAQWLVDAFAGGKSATGLSVTADSALKYTPVWAAVNIIAGAVGFLPFMVYRRLAGGGKEPAGDSRLYRLVHDRANPHMSAQEFREVIQGHALTWGNGYAEIERDNAARPVWYWPLRPDQTTPYLNERGDLFYEVRLTGGTLSYLPYRNVLHIKGLGGNGYQGYSVVRYHRESIGLGQAAEKYGGKFFGNSSTPSGILQHPKTLGDKARDNLRTEFEAMHRGLDQAQRTAILEEGMTWQQIGIPPEDAQFLQTRKFQVNDVARIFQIPPHMLAEMDRATFSNIEHQGIEFVVHTLMRWLKKWEHECNYKLFGEWTSGSTYTEFVVEGLLRGDTAARATFYREMHNNGFMTINEVRDKENMNPLPGKAGDMHFVNAALKPVEQMLLESKEPKPAEPAPDEPEPDDDPLLAAQRALLLDVCGRIVRKEISAIRKAAHRKDFGQTLKAFYDTHDTFIRQVLGPVITAVATAIHTDVGPEFIAGYISRLGWSWRDMNYQAVLETAPDDLLPLVGGWQQNLAGKYANKILADIKENGRAAS